MSTMSLLLNQQLNCQNSACLTLRNSLEELSKLVAAAQSIINNIQPIIANTERPPLAPNQCPVSTNGDEGSQSDLDDEENCTENLICPYPKCKKESYSCRENLKRHFTTHVACNKKCRFCSNEIHTVRRYALHFDSCMKRNLSDKPLGDAKREKRELNKRATKELDEMSNQDAEVDGMDLKGKSRKRKATDTVPLSQGPQADTSDVLEPDTGFPPATIAAEESTHYSFINVPQSWNENSFSTTDNAFPPRLETNGALFYPLIRAKVFNGCTNDWNQNYLEQCMPNVGDKTTLPFSENSTNLFVPDQIPTECDPQLVASYGVT